jgi:ribosome-associated translation inhibitor RaiA
VAIGLITAGIFITGAYPHPDLNDHHHNQTDSADETNLASTGNATLAAKRLAFIQASNEDLYAHLDEALARINKNLQQNKELANRISR